MKRTIALAVIAVFILGGCSKEAANNAVASSAPTTGCSKTATEELYVKDMYACASTRVYLFADSTARDNWRKAAEGFGSVVVSEGDTWLEVKA